MQIVKPYSLNAKTFNIPFSEESSVVVEVILFTATQDPYCSLHVNPKAGQLSMIISDRVSTDLGICWKNSPGELVKLSKAIFSLLISASYDVKCDGRFGKKNYFPLHS